MRTDIKESIDNYVAHGWEPGGFLRAVLENDLMEAIGRADSQNRHDLFDICCYIYNDIPSACHGSKEIVHRWIEKAKKKEEANVNA